MHSSALLNLERFFKIYFEKYDNPTILDYGGAALDNQKAGIQFLLLTYLFHTLGELCLSPVGLSATAKYSPTRFRGQMMGIWFLSSSLAAGLAGLLASKSFESGIASMPNLFSQIIIALIVVGIVLFISSRFVKASPIDENS